MRNLTILALASALCACGGDPAATNEAVANEPVAIENAIDVGDEPTADAGEAAPEAPRADDTPEADEPAPAPTETPEPEPTEAPDDSADAGTATIPAALRGRWGLVAADCTSTRGDAKGLIRVTRDTIRFYESRAPLGRVAARDRSRIVADFAFEGEGQTWRKRMVLDARDGGRTLVRRESGDDAMPGALRYRRCENI